MARRKAKRKTAKKSKVMHVGFTAPIALVAKYQKQAKKLGVSRATWIRNELAARL